MYKPPLVQRGLQIPLKYYLTLLDTFLSVSLNKLGFVELFVYLVEGFLDGLHTPYSGGSELTIFSYRPPDF